MEILLNTQVASSHATKHNGGERRLWVAVLTKAIEDWRSGTGRSRKDAQRFLFQDTDHFNRVCVCAGQDPGPLRAKLATHFARS